MAAPLPILLALSTLSKRPREIDAGMKHLMTEPAGFLSVLLMQRMKGPRTLR